MVGLISYPTTSSVNPNKPAVVWRELKMLRGLFSMAPWLKSSTAATLCRFRSVSYPNLFSPHFIDAFKLHIAQFVLVLLSGAWKLG